MSKSESKKDGRQVLRVFFKVFEFENIYLKLIKQFDKLQLVLSYVIFFFHYLLVCQNIEIEPYLMSKGKQR